MANSALKISLFVVLLSGVLSGFNAIGVYASASQNQYNLNDQQWYSISDNTTGTVADQTGIQNKLDSYSAASTAFADFIIGTVYLKIIIDNWCLNNWVIGIFTAIMQGGIYLVSITGALGWVLNKFNTL